MSTRSGCRFHDMGFSGNHDMYLVSTPLKGSVLKCIEHSTVTNNTKFDRKEFHQPWADGYVHEVRACTMGYAAAR
jgi:hypothetical protein